MFPKNKPKSESADVPVIDMELVKSSLEAMIDFSGDKLDTVMLDKFIAGVRAIDSTHFEWTVNVAPGKVSKVRCVVGGRKTSPTVEIEGVSPLTYDFYFVDTDNKNTYRSGVLHRLLLQITGSFSENPCQMPYPVLSWEFTIDFETAKVFRKLHGKYLRANQWEDITVEVRVS